MVFVTHIDHFSYSTLNDDFSTLITWKQCDIHLFVYIYTYDINTMDNICMDVDMYVYLTEQFLTSDEFLLRIAFTSACTTYYLVT